MRIFNKFVWSKKAPKNENDIWFDGSVWKMFSQGEWEAFTVEKEAATKINKLIEDSFGVYQEKLTAGKGIKIENNTISTTSLFSIVNYLPDIGEENIIYLLYSTEVEDKNKFVEYIWLSNKWEKLGEFKADIDLSPYLTKTEAQGIYQPQEKGKGLSSNDYTTAEKNKLSSLENYDDSGLRAELSRIDTTKASKEDVEELSERIAENDVLIEDLQNTKIDKEADDYYPQLSVGVADNLSGVEVVDSSFTTRQSGGGAITDGVARVQSIKGNSVVWNQLVSTDRIISLQGDVNITILESGEIYAEGEGESFLGSSVLTPQVPLENGHKYLYNFDVKKDIKETIGVSFGNVWNNPSGGFPIPADTWYHVESIAAPTGELNRGLWIYPWNNTQLTACKAWIKNLVVYDLTKMFGEGNEPSTIEEFYQRIPMGIDLYAYNEGEVISMNVNGIKSVGVKEGEESTEDLSIVGKYFPNGMNGVGSAYDDIRYNKSTNKWEKVVRFGEVELGTLSYIKSGIGANAFYTLSLQGKVKNAGKLLTSQFCQVGGITSSRDAEMSVDSAGTIYFSSFAHTDAASFKAAMAGVILYYELAEPIVTEIDEQDFNTDYLVWNGGTESALASKPSSALRAEITYGFNAVGKIKEIDDKLTELSTQVGGLSEKVDELGEGSVFEAEYNVTPYADIVEAYKKNKHCICRYNNMFLSLTKLNYEGNDTAEFSAFVNDTQYIVYCFNNNKWSNTFIKVEKVANKVTSINQSSNNNEYPSAKAVYDFVNNAIGNVINGEY